MNCPESHELLLRWLDGHAMGAGIALDQHLAQCSDCRQLHAAANYLTDGLRRLPSPTPPAGLAPRIIARVLADQRARGVWRRRAVTLAAAAALLLAVLGSYVAGLGPFRPVPGNLRADRTVHRPVAKDSRAKTASPRLEQTLEEAGSLALALTRKTAGETVAQARRWLPPANPLPVSLPGLEDTKGFAPVLDPPAQTLREAGKNFSAGLMPVTSSARRAVNLFLHEVSPMGMGPPSGS